MAKTTLDVLQSYFGFDHFLPGQEEVIDAILEGVDVLAIRATGSGKSISFQVPALMLDGITVVISPLISLMLDQVETLQRLGIPSLAIHSGMDSAKLRQCYGQVSSGKLKLIYISPERATSGTFPMVLKTLHSQKLIARIVVDEAHCIAEWGREFRPSYGRLADLRKICNGIPLVALTATAIPKIQKAICAKLEFNKTFKTFLSHFDRSNLSYEVLPTPNQKNSQLYHLLKSDLTPPGIIFCSSRKSVTEVSEFLNEKGFNTIAYHGGMSSFLREKNQEAFLKGKVPWMVATSAFGMGIHKENLRTVIHYHLPASLEQYIQECGRAGRDNQNARCIMLFSIADRRIHEALMVRSQPSLSGIELLLNLIDSRNQHWETNEAELLNLLKLGNRNPQSLVLDEKSLQKYLSILEEYGWIQWLRERGIWTITKLPFTPSLDEIARRLHDRMKESFSRLNTMEKFCTHQGCLRNFLTHELDGPNCFQCNNCSGCTGVFKIKIDASNPIVQTILEFVKKYPEHTQLSTITWVLSGSKSRIVKQNKLDHFQFYGELKTFSQLEIREVAKSLFYAGKIQRNNELKSIQLATA